MAYGITVGSDAPTRKKPKKGKKKPFPYKGGGSDEMQRMLSGAFNFKGARYKDKGKYISGGV